MVSMILPPSFFWIHRITSESENPLPLLPALPIATIPSKCYNKFAEILQTLNKKEEMNMLDPKVAELLNTQVNKEFYSAYLYLDFANYYKDQGLDGFANWYNIQAQEERDHAMLFIQYLQNNGERVTLESIDKPEAVLAGFEDPLKAGLEHEQYVTSLIHAIYDAAYAQNDFRTMQFLDWFVKEQGEEEKNADDLITKFNLFGHDSRSLYMLDSELAARVYSAPSLVL